MCVEYFMCIEVKLKTICTVLAFLFLDSEKTVGVKGLINSL